VHRFAFLVVAVLGLAVPPARAHHRQTPPIVAITNAGDASLPRLAPASRKAAAVVVDATIAVVNPFRTPSTPAFTFTSGTNANPSISSNGRTVAWDSDADPLALGGPGRQIVEQTHFGLLEPTVDPTGTSANPALDLIGISVAFESTADLAGAGNAGARQIFFQQAGGPIRQLSRGVGTSRNASVDLRSQTVVFESTSHPLTGDDTGVAQIWIANLVGGTADPITSGLGASTNPTLSNDGRVIVFESRADLAGDGHKTDTPQVFAYDTVSKTFARVTNDAGGCTGPTAARIKRDWRIGYVCGGGAAFTMLRANQRFEVATVGGDTTRLVPQADAHFMLVATTANLAGAGTTAGHQVYMVNLFKRPPTASPSAVVWFPFQGLSPL
jgi:hypothetical protein